MLLDEALALAISHDPSFVGHNESQQEPPSTVLLRAWRIVTMWGIKRCMCRRCLRCSYHEEKIRNGEREANFVMFMTVSSMRRHQLGNDLDQVFECLLTWFRQGATVWNYEHGVNDDFAVTLYPLPPLRAVPSDLPPLGDREF